MSYKNQSHIPDLLSDFHEIFKNGDNKYCDVALQCFDGIVKVPGIVLAAICPMLRNMGEHSSTEMETNILLPDFYVSTHSTHSFTHNF